MTSTDRIDAIHLAMASGALYHYSKGNRRPVCLPSEDAIRELAARGGEEWRGMRDRMVRAARPLVTEDGEWSHEMIYPHGEIRRVVEVIGVDDVIAAAQLAQRMDDARRAGNHALVRAALDAVTAHVREVEAEAAEVLHDTLAAERGL